MGKEALFIIPLILSLGFTTIPFVDALQDKDAETVCIEGKILVFRTIANNYVCVSESTAKKWVQYGIAEIVRESVEEEMMEEETMEETTEGETMDEETMDATPEEMTSSIPEEAIGPMIDFEKGYLVEEIQDGLYWLTDGMYQVMFLTTGEGVIAVDAPPSLGSKYLDAISEVTDEPITHIIYSHTHTDHIGAAAMFPTDVEIIAHEETTNQLEQRNDPNRPLPTISFADSYILEVGNKRLELDYNGPIHEPGNIFIYAPEQNVLMLVDVVFPGWVPFKDLALAEDVPAFIGAHDLIMNYEFDTFIGGHLTRIGTPEDVQIQQDYFDDVQENAATANQEVDFMAIAAEVGWENPWLLFDTYMDAITQSCVDATVPDWVDRLGGVEVFTEDHCFKISESQRID